MLTVQGNYIEPKSYLIQNCTYYVGYIVLEINSK